MKFIKFLPHAGIIAILAGLMQLLDLKCPMFIAWMGFAAWACYFVAGSTVKGGAKVIGCWAAGLVGAIAIIEIGERLTSLAGGNAEIGFPIAVTCIAFIVILFENVPALDVIPVWFIGAACFFALNGANTNLPEYKTNYAIVMITCVVGQIFGFVTVLLRGKYGAWIDAEKAPAEKEAEPETT